MYTVAYGSAGFNIRSLSSIATVTWLTFPVLTLLSINELVMRTVRLNVSLSSKTLSSLIGMFNELFTLPGGKVIVYGPGL